MNLSFGVKIRFLLLVLGCCLIATSISISRLTTKRELLERDAEEIQKNLNAKEKLVFDFLEDKKSVANAKQFHHNPKLALDFLSIYKKEKGVSLLTFEDNQLKFWSSIKAINIDPSSIKDGNSVLYLANGWYEVIKSTQENFDFIFLITIQAQYGFKETEYFKNDIDLNLSTTDALTLASFTDKDVFAIKDLNNKFLFGLKIKPGYIDNYYTSTQMWLFIAALLSFCMFVNSLCSLIARKGYVLLATLLLTAFFALFRFSDLYFGWFNHRFVIELFDPKIYAESFTMPSLGDLLMNIIMLTWLLLFMFNNKEQYKFNEKIKGSKTVGIIIHVLFLLFIGTIAYYSDEVFFGLIYNSKKINFEIINILKLGGTSWVSIIILCLVWFQIYLVTIVSATVSKQLNVTNKERIIIFLAGFTLVFVYKLSTDFTAFFIIFALILFIVTRSVYVKGNKFSVGLFALVFFCLAFNTSIKYIKYKDIKERSLREPLAQKVQSSEDPNAINALGILESNLLKDDFIVRYFKEDGNGNYAVLQNYIKNYLDGYLSRYDYQIYPYDRNGEDVNNPHGQAFGKYKSLVESGTVKIDGAKYFYQVNNTFGYQDYFGIISVVNNGELLGNLVIELRSKPYNNASKLPDLLGDQRLIRDEDFSGYSIALYSNNILLNQSGNYTYPLNGDVFKAQKENFITNSDNITRYSHLIYKPSESKMVIISREKVNYVERLAALSFFFIVFIIFSLLLYGLVWLIKNLDSERGGWFSINRSLMINANKILYKTRIQVSIVLSVVATLVIVGWVTYYSMNNEYRGQQNAAIKEKIRKVQQNFEKQIFSKGITYDESAIADFNNFADINNADLNLYDTKGNLIISTYPKLYESNVIGRKISALAYTYLSQLKRSEYINTNETIGNLTYASAYAPIRNAQNLTIAYIGLPNYYNEEEYSDKIALFLSNLINIYALVFVAVGVLAVFLANQITSPLTFIQESINSARIGQLNEPIKWRRQDEIGFLIKEYNSMISALEQSALKLAQSERESAWREMAKQVAHEIKNPLTPLKLGVQLLEKSWKENDPNFEIKFNKFNKSFIEQIDSLSKIASEFSNFAKMPDTNLQKLDILPIIEQAREVFKSASHVEINVLNKADQKIMLTADYDQLLRSFNNLFKNAIEAVKGDNSCIITAVIYNDNRNAYVEIKDNGRGIPTTLHDSIFVPNFTTKTSGTGLGLAFVKQAVENAGGTVSFTSVQNVGTTFYLTFPLS